MLVATRKGHSGKRYLTMKSLSISQWYYILRAHYHWTVFESIRYALWLVR